MTRAYSGNERGFLYGEKRTAKFGFIPTNLWRQREPFSESRMRYVVSPIMWRRACKALM
jgi:hypothetical protein